MHLSSLSIFSKNTDAAAVIKGYEFQKLKTLETWLSNKVNQVDEIIYCDYEEDIFQRDIVNLTAKFSQIKLYSSKTFSFKSEEITKALAHFFMLFIKGEYVFDNVTFIFETNTIVGRKNKDNDAELLEAWHQEQDTLDPALLQRCIEKVKEIVTSYVTATYPDAIKKDKSAAQAAWIDFQNMPPEVWERFTKTIRWRFTGQTAEEAVAQSIDQINASIAQLPFPTIGEKNHQVFTTLYYARVVPARLLYRNRTSWPRRP